MLFDNSRVAVAMINNIIYKTLVKILHAFIIMERNGKEYIVDATCNVIMEKETYLNLFGANILNEIPNEKVLRDVHYIQNSETAKYIMYADYLCFPDEIMQGVKTYTKNN